MKARSELMKSASSPCRNGLSRCATHSSPGPIDGSRSAAAATAGGASSSATAPRAVGADRSRSRSRGSATGPHAQSSGSPSRRTGASATKAVERLVAEQLDRPWARVRVTQDRLAGQRRGGCREHDVAEAVPRHDRGGGEGEHVGVDRSRGWRRPRGSCRGRRRERVHDDDPVGGEEHPELVEELEGRHVARRDAAREDVDDGEVVAAVACARRARRPRVRRRTRR